MVKRSVEDFFPKNYPIKIDDIEIKNGKLFPTFYLMDKLEKKYKD